MWHQQPTSRSGANDEQDMKEISRPTCTSGHETGISYSSGSNQQWKQDVASPSFTKDYSDGDKMSMYDSGLTDSGFISEANLVSSECIVEEMSPPQNFGDTFANKSSASHVEKEESNSYMRLDSGVDVELDDEFRNLSFKNISSLNALNVKQNTIIPSLSFTSGSVAGTDRATSDSQQSRLRPDLLHSSKESLLQNWQQYFKQDEDGDTQLHIAIVQGFIEVVYSLIRMVPNPTYLDIVNDISQTPLHLAVLTRQARIVRLLLVAGAKVGVLDRHGNTALHLACRAGDTESFGALTEPIAASEMAAVNLCYATCMQQVPHDLQARNYEGQMCIHLAATCGHVDVLRRLVAIGADINAREARCGRTALHYAVERKILPVLWFFFEGCCLGPGGVNFDTRTYAGYTAYQMANLIDLTLSKEMAKRALDLGLLLETETKPKEMDSDYDSESSSEDS